jgi:hypothetical protein
VPVGAPPRPLPRATVYSHVGMWTSSGGSRLVSRVTSEHVASSTFAAAQVAASASRRADLQQQRQRQRQQTRRVSTACGRGVCLDAMSRWTVAYCALITGSSRAATAMGSFIMLTVVLGGELVGRGELLALVVVVVSVERLLSVASL